MSRPDTWMPLYIGDYLRDTGHLSTEEHGAYLLLIMQAWTRDGLLPPDDERLRLLAKLDAKSWKRSRITLLAFFTQSHEGYRHKRLDRELANTQAMVEQRRAAGKASAAARRRQRNSNGRSTDDDEDPEDENEKDDETDRNDRSETPSDSVTSASRKLNDIKEGQSTSVRTADPTNSLRNGRPSPSPSQGRKERIPEASLPRANNASDFDVAVDAWNGMAARCGLACVSRLTDERKRRLRQRLAECGSIEGWHDAVRLVSESPFLLGQQNRSSWKADFDFVLQAKSFTRLMEGSYAETTKIRKTASEVMAETEPANWFDDENFGGLPA